LRPDLVITYRHHPVTAEPHYVGQLAVEAVAEHVRRQLGCGDEGPLAVELERLTEIRSLRVNGITYELEWSTSDPVTDDDGSPVLGVCEFDPQGLPDTALISVNPEPIEGRRELLLSTAAHELGHGIFDAAAWIHGHQRSSAPGLFDLIEPSAPMRVWRTTTRDEGHFTASHAPGTKLFFQESRANDFMGSVLTPRRSLTHHFMLHCQVLNLDPSPLMSTTTYSLLLEPEGAVPTAPRKGNLGFLNLDLRLGLAEVLSLLAMDFGVTRRFIEVRLKRYGLLPQAMPTL
jgi:hypothetical protein